MINRTVNINYSGEQHFCPDNNDWEKFQNPEALRNFLICADSWKKHGWKVRRISHNNVVNPIHFLSVGRIQKQYHWYPEKLWQIFAAMYEIGEPGYNLFIESDVINTGLNYFDRLVNYEYDVIRLQKETFTLASMIATRAGIFNLIKTLIKYDRGELPEIRTTYVGSDTIFRTYLDIPCYPIQKFPCSEGEFPLIHYARATLNRIYQEIPTNAD